MGPRSHLKSICTPLMTSKNNGEEISFNVLVGDKESKTCEKPS